MIAKFIEKFREQTLEDDTVAIKPETKFRDLGSWDSLTGMSVLVMIKDEYGVDMPDDALKACTTIQDIFDYVTSKR